MVTVSNLSFSYKDNTPIFRFPDFNVMRGAHVILLGESGSGKTTLLHMLGGLLRKYEGSIRVDDTELKTLSETSLDEFRARHMGFVFQRNHLIQALTVEKNILLSSYLADAKQDLDRVHAVLSQLGIDNKARSKVTELSQGQMQRVAIARAVFNKPALLLADEPTSALDNKNCERVINLLINVAEENKSTLVIATHDQRLKDSITNTLILS